MEYTNVLCVCDFLLHSLLRRSFIFVVFFFICSLFFCCFVCWRWQFYRVVEFLGKSYFHVKINPFKQLWCFNRIAFGNLLHVPSWRVRVCSIYFVTEREFEFKVSANQINCLRFTLAKHNNRIKRRQRKNFNKAMIFFVTSTERTKKQISNVARQISQNFSKSHMALFGIRFGQVNATSFFFSLWFAANLVQFMCWNTHFLELHAEWKKSKNKTASTTGHSADCRRNRCINRHKIFQFLRMDSNRVFVFFVVVWNCFNQLWFTGINSKSDKKKCTFT